jgi:hypothetical protein
MGYCTPVEYLNFMRETPDFERMLTHADIHLVKLWFSVSRAEQAARFAARSSSLLYPKGKSTLHRIRTGIWRRLSPICAGRNGRGRNK